MKSFDLSFLTQYQETTVIVSGKSRIGVFHCRNQIPGTPKAIAIKTLPDNSDSKGECDRHVLLSSLLSSVVKCYGSIKTENEYKLILEYCSQGSLEDLIDHKRNTSKPSQNRWSEEELIRYFLDLTKTVKALHDLNFVHRDIKPGNVFVTENGEVKLGDFGDARRILQQEMNNQQTRLHGTPAFFSPELIEQFANLLRGAETGTDFSACFATDVYTLGTTFLSMATLEFTPRKLNPRAKNQAKRLVVAAGYSEALGVLISNMREPEFGSRLRISQVLFELSQLTCNLCAGKVLGLVRLCSERMCGECFKHQLCQSFESAKELLGLFCPLCGCQIDIRALNRVFFGKERIQVFQLIEENLRFPCPNPVCHKAYPPLIVRKNCLQSYSLLCSCGLNYCSWCRSTETCNIHIQ